MHIYCRRIEWTMGDSTRIVLATILPRNADSIMLPPEQDEAHFKEEDEGALCFSMNPERRRTSNTSSTRLTSTTRHASGCMRWYFKVLQRRVSLLDMLY
jgi:hypothetical protein